MFQKLNSFTGQPLCLFLYKFRGFGRLGEKCVCVCVCVCVCMCVCV